MEKLDSDTPDGAAIALHARAVQFDLTDVPAHYVYGHPVATHLYNALSLLLPAGEEWFITVLKEALPHIDDGKLREDVIGFMGQESQHANAHAGLNEYLTRHEIDPGPMIDRADYVFGNLLGPREVTGEKAHNYLVERLAVIAALEHIFAFLGDWVLNAEKLNAQTAHPTIVDLLRWHGAEEVEHRMVSHDVLHHFDGSYLRRVRAQAVVAPILLYLIWQGMRYLLRVDPNLDWTARRRKHVWRNLFRSARKGLTPSITLLVLRALQYFKPRYTPGDVGNTAQAVAYLAASPATRPGPSPSAR
ncbi:metal-dependent hydrolase [Mycolicibacterium sp. P9-22]|uniref:metal-dependent hydrolase n=1 Tax=Mycolicibacterium sp. P9-22 TaxID=2024613 RepID=UPI0011EE5939|nr:metal-dependent hydrolase [Mycolicibacterium sp. P9-22]KAA0110965.1 metal-dependent hydrolase [Mycolicibacterium sp. P9-22]